MYTKNPRDSTKIETAAQHDEPAIFGGGWAHRGGTSLQCEYAYWIITLTLGGQCVYEWEDNSLTVGAGEILLHRPHTPIHWRVPRSVGEWKVVDALFRPRPHWRQWLAEFEFQCDEQFEYRSDSGRDGKPRSGRAGFLLLRPEPPVVARVRRGLLSLTRIYSGGAFQTEDLALLILERVLLALRLNLPGASPQLDRRVLAALRFIHANLAQALTVREVARAACTSPSHLAYLFASQMGSAPMQYVERLRLEQAAKMLRHSALPISEIAAAAGYRDAEYFSNRFRRNNGLSPRAFRQAARAQAGE
jgi:AraC family transcriptional regulator, arabinose operon regulatory protein